MKKNIVKSVLCISLYSIAQITFPMSSLMRPVITKTARTIITPTIAAIMPQIQHTQRNCRTNNSIPNIISAPENANCISLYKESPEKLTKKYQEMREEQIEQKNIPNQFRNDAFFLFAFLVYVGILTTPIDFKDLMYLKLQRLLFENQNNEQKTCGEILEELSFMLL